MHNKQMYTMIFPATDTALEFLKSMDLSCYKYEAEENPKRKHHWNNNYAGFKDQDGVTVGKCPANITGTQAEALLHNGIAWSPPTWEKPYPNRIYVVYQGVVYRATPTNPGVSYHGFPETGKDLRRLPKGLQDEIMQSARSNGWEKEVKKWFDR